MPDTTHHLAELNIARLRFPLDHPEMTSFVEQLAWINAVADRAEGFVWRLQTEEGNATGVRASEDDRLLVNLSVWTSVETLYDYTYHTDHLGPLRDRRRWFERMQGPHFVMWWVPAGHRPTLEEAMAKLEHLRTSGPTPVAFDFKHTFDAAAAPLRTTRRGEWTC